MINIPQVPPALMAKDICLSLKGNQILDHISLTLPKGKMIGLIGPNGAGKSSLLRCILGLVEPQSGTITLDGEDLSSWTLKERARKISYAAQGAPIHWPLTVEHVVSLGRIPHLGPWQKIREQDEIIIRRAMEITDTRHLAERLVTTLSGGERACVMLARAIVSEAEYLCADEPIASLDPYHQLQVMDILKKLAMDGHGILIVLHDLSLAQRYCDELFLMQDGGLLAHGTTAEVLTEKNLDQAYHIKASRWQENGDSFLAPWKRSGKPDHKDQNR